MGHSLLTWNQVGLPPPLLRLLLLDDANSVTRWGDLLDFWQIFKVFGNN